MKNRSKTVVKDTIKQRDYSAFTIAAGCRLSEPKSLFVGIYVKTNGQPCTDCNLKPCVCFDRFKAEDRGKKAPALRGALKTNAELADEHGITKRQAAKRRIPGTNDLKAE